jgi:hypothetical protein
MEKWLAIYETEIVAAFERLLAEVLELRKHAYSNDVHYPLLRVLAGRCGAACSAAAKRCKRALVLEALLKAKAERMDITPTVAGHVFERLIGRSVDNRATLSAFAQPGRSAADKSKITAENLAELEAKLIKELRLLVSEMQIIREDRKEDYKAKAEANTKKHRR